MGVTPLVDLPGVGRNLSEHVQIGLEYDSKPITFLNELRADRVARHVAEWFVFGTGAFATQINACNILLRTQPDLDRPDIQIQCNPIRMDAKIWFPGLTEAQQHRFDSQVVLLHPRSRGHVELRSSDPADKPRIFLNLLSEPEDFTVLRRGLREARRIYRSKPLGDYILDEIRPGADVQSDSELDDHIRKQARIVQHPVGTCSMGTGPEAVVDPQLRVRGVEGLRVIDASIMPEIVSGNTNAAAIMIGERGADLVLGRNLPPADL
jgi:choline dehydrogenase